MSDLSPADRKPHRAPAAQPEQQDLREVLDRLGALEAAVARVEAALVRFESAPRKRFGR